MSIDLFKDVVLDGLLDTLHLVPFLLITYLVMEVLEHTQEARTERIIRSAGVSGPAIGALLGALPQCGFSAMAATLYAGRLVTAGTLVAVILSTSDELIPVFLANGAPVAELGVILAVKVVLGMVVGFAVDAVLTYLHRAGDGHPHIRELCERAHCSCGDIEAAEEGEETEAPHAHHAGHVHAHDEANMRATRRALAILKCALVHTVQVSVFIFLVTVVFGLIMEGMGQEALAGLFERHPLFSTFLAALIGLVPNCAASVALSKLYLDRVIGFGPALAGLLVSGGMGLLVLYRTNRDLRENVIITAFIYMVGVVAGFIATLVV